jgi:hypothetical protein
MIGLIPGLLCRVSLILTRIKGTNRNRWQCTWVLNCGSYCIVHPKRPSLLSDWMAGRDWISVCKLHYRRIVGFILILPFWNSVANPCSSKGVIFHDIHQESRRQPSQWRRAPSIIFFYRFEASDCFCSTSRKNYPLHRYTASEFPVSSSEGKTWVSVKLMFDSLITCLKLMSGTIFA